ncbi:EamA family transporter [Bacillus suaedaesalsae]|uniref:EamA family transporter n=1 Tax=Bacillus suaedaesalsae TaxID=2810349 RepID=A0ABS2DG56_9BACI|nr:EamA family transporter [Bacillus suaedaesalsae]
MNQKLAYVFIIIAAVFWGIIGIFVTKLYELGFTPTQVVTIRAVSASLFLLIYIVIKNRNLLKINMTDSKYFVGTGIISFVFFNWCLFHAIQETSISIATILLYTAPAFVTLFSRLLFKESLTVMKVLALVLTLLGCSFVVGIFPTNQSAITLYGMILGLGSGFFYALYTIFGKQALAKYDSLTVTVYTFIFAAIAVIPFSDVSNFILLFSSKEAWMYGIGIGLLSTTLSFIFYTKGLTAVESSRASIMATIEPVVASILSFLLFNEMLTWVQYVGIFLVIVAVIMVQDVKGRRNVKSEKGINSVI